MCQVASDAGWCLQGSTDPVKVVTGILTFLEEHNHPRTCPPGTDADACAALAWFSDFGTGALAAAEASRERWRAGAPLSVLDGVPFAVKDNQDAAEYPTHCGTTFIHTLCVPFIHCERIGTRTCSSQPPRCRRLSSGGCSMQA